LDAFRPPAPDIGYRVKKEGGVKWTLSGVDLDINLPSHDENSARRLVAFVGFMGNNDRKRIDFFLLFKQLTIIHQKHLCFPIPQTGY
jgi:hypothetical protein